MLRGFEFLNFWAILASRATKGHPTWHRNFPLRSSPAHFFGLYGVRTYSAIIHPPYEGLLCCVVLNFWAILDQ